MAKIVAFGSSDGGADDAPWETFYAPQQSAGAPGVTTRQPGSLESWLPSLLVAAAIGAGVYVVARRKGYVANYENDDVRWLRLTYGKLPSRAEFDERFDAIAGSRYHLDGEQLSASSLWKMIEHTVKMRKRGSVDDDDMRLVSDILYTLKIEWI